MKLYRGRYAEENENEKKNNEKTNADIKYRSSCPDVMCLWGQCKKPGTHTDGRISYTDGRECE